MSEQCSGCHNPAKVCGQCVEDEVRRISAYCDALQALLDDMTAQARNLREQLATYEKDLVDTKEDCDAVAREREAARTDRDAADALACGPAFACGPASASLTS